MSHFADVVNKQIQVKNSALVIGLDPNLNNFPNFLKEDNSSQYISRAIYEFNKIVIDYCAEYAVAVKPQLAYYEVFGSEGIRAFEQTIAYAKSKGLIVINDGKRNDIGSTATAYAKAYLNDSPLAGDALTINSYLGSDGVLPFLDEAKGFGKGIFTLLKTSNPSSGELQDLELKDGSTLYLKLAELINEWSIGSIGKSGYSYLGAVVGATYPEIAKILRKKLPNTIFLVPGFGAQGGRAEELIPFFDRDGFGALINSARGIIYAYQNQYENWQELNAIQIGESMKIAAIRANEQINKVRKTK